MLHHNSNLQCQSGNYKATQCIDDVPNLQCNAMQCILMCQYTMTCCTWKEQKVRAMAITKSECACPTGQLQSNFNVIGDGFAAGINLMSILTLRKATGG